MGKGLAPPSDDLLGAVSVPGWVGRSVSERAPVSALSWELGSDRWLGFEWGEELAYLLVSVRAPGSALSWELGSDRWLGFEWGEELACLLDSVRVQGSGPLLDAE